MGLAKRLMLQAAGPGPLPALYFSDLHRFNELMALLPENDTAHVMIAQVIPVSVKHKLLLHRPLPCKTAAETAIQPLIWHSESLSSHKLCF